MKTYEEREAELREQEVADRETRAVTLESLGRILELERRVDVLSRVVMEMRTDQAAKAAAESGLDFYELQYEMEKERQRVKQDSDDLAYQEISMGQPPLDTRHPDQGMKQSPPPLPDRDELRSFAELLRETEVLARRYATKHGVAALKRIVDELPPFTDLSRNYQEAAAVAKLEEESKVSGVGADEGEGSSEPGRHRRPFPLYRPSPGGGMAAMAQEGVREEQEMRNDLAYQESARHLRWAAAKFINPRGRFHDLRPEINEILRRHYPATEARLSYPPAPPPSVSAAEETSSGGERSTAGGAGSCCADMARALKAHKRHGRRYGVGDPTALWYPERRQDLLPALAFCPWCGTKLDKET